VPIIVLARPRRFVALPFLVAAAALFTVAGAQQQLPPRQGDDDPRARSDYFEQQRAYPFQTIPLGARYRAMQQMRQLNLIAGGASVLSPITAWQSLGPAPITGNNTGRVSAIAIDPTNSQTIYAGGAQGGVWKTTNGGTSWTPLGDTQCSLAVGSITIDPVNPQIVYVGTGEENFSGDSYYGCGILRTTDGGGSWATLGQGTFLGSNGGAQIGKIVIDPATAGSTTTTTLWVASSWGLFKSTNSGTSFSSNLTPYPSFGYGYATDVVLPGTAGNPVFVAATSVWGLQGNGLYKSTDGGTTWNLVPGLPSNASIGRIALSVSPVNHSVMYASIENPSNGNLLGLYRTNDGGATWTQKTATGANCSAQCWYAMVITASPADTNTVYFSGFDAYKSTDQGNTFSDVSAVIHVDHHALTFDPQVATTVWAGTDGGVFRSLDAGATWTSFNTNLAMTQFYGGLSLHPTSGAVLGGAQDNGTLEYAGTPTWNWVIGGDGGYTAINQTNPNISYGETQWAPNSGYSGPRRRTSPAGAFNLVTTGINMGDQGLFIPPIAIDPVHTSFVYFGTSSLYRSKNGGDNWGLMSIAAAMFPLRGGYVSAIGVAPSDTNIVYAGSNQGELAVSSLGGWRTITTGIPQRYVTSIAVNRANSSIAYVTLSGFGSGHVWMTTNGGTSWTNISGNLPNIPVNAITLIPGGELVIGTDLGVFRSGDGGATWSVASTGLPNVAVFDVQYLYATKTLAAATHGRGVWTTTLTPTLTPATVYLESAPAKYTSGSAIAAGVSVSLREVSGMTVPGATNAITASITAGGGVLSGTTTVAAANGVATFSNLIITGTGAQTLSFATAGTTAATVIMNSNAPDSLVFAIGIDTASTAGFPSTSFALPVRLDLTKAATRTLGSVSSTITWDPTHVVFDSVKTVAAGTWSNNVTQVATGTLTIGLSAANITTTSTLLNLYLHGVATGKTLLTHSVTAAADATAVNLLTAPNTVVVAAPNRVCVADMWGDVNNDGVVSILDAQQIARFSVALSVGNLARLQAYGDVTADGSVNISDAQQVARFSVSLPVASRAGAPNAAECP